MTPIKKQQQQLAQSLFKLYRYRPRKQNLLGVFAVLFCGLAFGKFIISLDNEVNAARPIKNFRMDFAVQNIHSATRLCHSQTRLTYGAQLQSSDIDLHSSRYDDFDKMYRIFLEVRIGSASKNRPYVIDCRVLPEHRTAQYFHAIGQI